MAQETSQRARTTDRIKMTYQLYREWDAEKWADARAILGAELNVLGD